jgi:NADH dehydrogenase/NADH:ubiquinone oxidoreductase subunit G
MPTWHDYPHSSSNWTPIPCSVSTAQRTLARNAIADLQNAGHGERDHALFMAEQRVALARAAAEVDADRAKLDQLQREHDQIMLDASQADAATARAELARQRLQYEAAVQQAQMLQEQGAQATQQAQQAQAEATQAKKLAAAQAHAAALARKEARLAEAATQAVQGSGGSNAPTESDGHASLHLSGASFGSDSDNLTASGRRRVADFARSHAQQPIVIEPRGSSTARVLAGRRAVAVEAALEAAGAGQVSIRPVGRIAKGAEVELHTQ